MKRAAILSGVFLLFFVSLMAQRDGEGRRLVVPEPSRPIGLDPGRQSIGGLLGKYFFLSGPKVLERNDNLSVDLVAIRSAEGISVHGSIIYPDGLVRTFSAREDSLVNGKKSNVFSGRVGSDFPDGKYVMEVFLEDSGESVLQREKTHFNVGVVDSRELGIDRAFQSSPGWVTIEGFFPEEETFLVVLGRLETGQWTYAFARSSDGDVVMVPYNQNFTVPEGTSVSVYALFPDEETSVSLPHAFISR